MVSIRELISKLNATSVEYVVIGGVAARVHGSPMVTDDFDVCCAMTEQNMGRLIEAIDEIQLVFFDPRRIPLLRDPAELAKFRTILLNTTLGRFDVLRTVEPIGEYPSVLAESEPYTVDEQSFRVLTIDALIRAKSFAGRDKDRVGVAHLEAIKRRRGEQSMGNDAPPG